MRSVPAWPRSTRAELPRRLADGHRFAVGARMHRPEVAVGPGRPGSRFHGQRNIAADPAVRRVSARTPAGASGLQGRESPVMPGRFPGTTPLAGSRATACQHHGRRRGCCAPHLAHPSRRKAPAIGAQNPGRTSPWHQPANRRSIIVRLRFTQALGPPSRGHGQGCPAVRTCPAPAAPPRGTRSILCTGKPVDTRPCRRHCHASPGETPSTPPRGLEPAALSTKLSSLSCDGQRNILPARKQALLHRRQIRPCAHTRVCQNWPLHH